MTDLLVSVRNPAEALAALKGGASIVDVKEPNRGALGFADIEQIRQIQEVVPPAVSVSVALGEANEWMRPALPQYDGIQPMPQYAKLGLADMKGPDWIERWLKVRQTCEAKLFQGNQPSWVAVAYTDFSVAQCPEPLDVLKAAIKTNCAAFLLDTFNKSGEGTLKLLTTDQLIALRQAANEHGLLFALAGKINRESLPAAMSIQPDIVGIRGAACSQNNRTASIESDRVRGFLNGMTADQKSAT